MIRVSCHCGAVTVAIEALPTFINDCNCSLCRNSGAVWGYFSTGQVVVTGETSIFVRPDRDEPAVTIHSCSACHATTHWTLTESFLHKTPDADRMGVNMRLFPSDLLKGVEIRFPDGASWDGKEDFGFRREAFVASDETQF